MFVDPSGHLASAVLGLIGIFVCGLITGFVNVLSKSESETALGAFVGGFAEGVISATTLAIGCTVGALTGGAGFVWLGGLIAVGGGFVAGKYGNALGQLISYGNVDWEIANLNGCFAAVFNLASYLGLLTINDILPKISSASFFAKIMSNAKLSVGGMIVTGYFSLLSRPTLNEFRDEERIKSGKGRFILGYLFS